MKRIVSISLVFLFLLSCFVLPASAAASNVYVFERFEMPYMLDSFPFSPNDQLGYYIYEGVLPEGLYTIECSLTSSFSGCSVNIPGVHTVQYQYIDGDLSGYGFSLTLSFTMVDSSGVEGITLSGELFVFRPIIDGESVTMILFDAGEFFSIIDSVCFVGYDQGNGLIGDFLEDPNNVFNPIISILPVVIPVAASFVGIRKAISWLRSKLSGA